MERQRGGVEEEQPSSEEHEHVRFGRFCCTANTNAYSLPGTWQKTSQGRWYLLSIQINQTYCNSTNRALCQTSCEKVRKHREELIKFAKSLRNVEPDARSSFSILAHGSNQCIVLIICWTLFWWPSGQNLNGRFFSGVSSNMTGSTLRTRSTCTTRLSRESREWLLAKRKWRLEHDPNAL